MDKDQVIRTLKEMGDLLEIAEANTFEVMAYRNGMRSLDDFDGDLAEAVEAETLTEVWPRQRALPTQWWWRVEPESTDGR